MKRGDEDDIASIPIYIEDVMQRALKFGFEPSPHPYGTPATLDFSHSFKYTLSTVLCLGSD